MNAILILTVIWLFHETGRKEHKAVFCGCVVIFTPCKKTEKPRFDSWNLSYTFRGRECSEEFVTWNDNRIIFWIEVDSTQSPFWGNYTWDINENKELTEWVLSLRIVSKGFYKQKIVFWVSIFLRWLRRSHHPAVNVCSDKLLTEKSFGRYRMRRGCKKPIKLSEIAQVVRIRICSFNMLLWRP